MINKVNCKIRNQNFETRNKFEWSKYKVPKQFQIFLFRILCLFRISDFDIRIYRRKFPDFAIVPVIITKKIKQNKLEQGQALVTLLFFAIIGVTITVAAVIVIIVNSLSGMKYQQGEQAYSIAVAGANNALIRLLRTPDTYTGETLTVGEGTATIVVSGAGTSASPYVIMSTGSDGNFSRKVQITATYTNNQLTPSSPQEIF